MSALCSRRRQQSSQHHPFDPATLPLPSSFTSPSRHELAAVWSIMPSSRMGSLTSTELDIWVTSRQRF